MKKFMIIAIAAVSLGAIGCRVGKGCPSNGRNVGAERILSGDAKTLKAVKKAGKFRS